METTKSFLEIWEDKIFKLKAGKRITCNDEFLDYFHALYHDKVNDDLYNHFRTIPNPTHLGTKDTYLAWIE